MKENKPSICILTECTWPDIGGGVTQALGLAGFLKEKGYPVFFLTQTKGLKLPQKDVFNSIPICRVYSLSYRFGKYIMFFPSLLFLVKHRREYDIIYVCGFRILGLLGVIAARFLGKKCILKAESMGEYSGEIFKWGSNLLRNRFFSSISDLLFRMRNNILRRADKFIAISRHIKEEFAQNGVSLDKIEYIPNGIDRNIFYSVSYENKMGLRKKLNLPISKKIVIYTGRLNKGKGLEMLLDVWKKNSNENKNACLVIAGSGSNQFLSIEDQLKQFVKENRLDEFVVFTGYVYNINEYLCASDVFVLPSELEGLSCSILEALACGLAVVVTDVGGAPEVIENGKNGILIHPYSPDELYTSLRNILDGNLDVRGCLPEIFYLENVLNRYNDVILSLG